MERSRVMCWTMGRWFLSMIIPLTFPGLISGLGSLALNRWEPDLDRGQHLYGFDHDCPGTQLQLGNNTASGNIAGNVLDNGTLAVSRHDALFSRQHFRLGDLRTIRAREGDFNRSQHLQWRNGNSRGRGQCRSTRN